MEMFNPPHPGELIREDCMEPLGLTVTEAAKGLGSEAGKSGSKAVEGLKGLFGK